MSTPEGADAALPGYPGLSVPRTGGAAVVVRGLRKKFGAKEAVAGIDLEVAAGSLAGLVGPNGAGKTTSLSMMTGLLRPDSGQIGKAGSRESDDDLRGQTILPQIYHPESKGNPEGQVPPRNVELGLDRFSLGLRDRL